MIKGIIFDLDGTLLDTELIWVDALIETYKIKNINISYKEAMSLIYGRSWRDIYLDLEKKYPNTFVSIEAVEKISNPIFIEIRNKKDVKIKSSISLLKELSKNYPIAIISGSGRETIRESIELMNIEKKVDFYIGCEEYAVGKPNPKCFLMGAQKFNLKPEECLVFEDSVAGVEAAKSANMKCVALNRNQKEYQALDKADIVLEDLADFNILEFEKGL